MRLNAIALDREFDNGTNQTGWGITDGSAGLRGRVIKTDDLAEIKLFAATFLSGAAGALTRAAELFIPRTTTSTELLKLDGRYGSNPAERPMRMPLSSEAVGIDDPGLGGPDLGYYRQNSARRFHKVKARLGSCHAPS